MKQIFLLLAVLILATIAFAQDTKNVASANASGAVFRDCPECPEMVVVPDGKFTMGSSDSEKSWAASRRRQRGLGCR